MVWVIVAALAITGSAWAFWNQVSNPRQPKPLDKRPIIAAIGDSNTYGWGVLFRGRNKNSYPAKLNSLLDGRFQVLNFGLNGRTIQSHGDMPYESHIFFKVSQQLNPSLVIIMLGTNDAKRKNWLSEEAFATDLRKFVGSYSTALDNKNVVLVTPPMAYKNRFNIIPDLVAKIRTLTMQVGSDLGIQVVDVFNNTALQRDTFPDGIHLNAHGYQAIAKQLTEEIDVLRME